MKDIRSEVDNITEIVPIPSIVGSIMTELISEETAIEQLIRLIESDAVLTVLILRAANSAFYGLRGEVTTARHAVILLGYKEIGKMILMYEMKRKLLNLNPQQSEYLQKLWAHSVSTAMIARTLAKLTGWNNEGEEFTAGLLHDIGKIVLIQHFTDSLVQTQRMIADLNMSDVEAEKQNLAISHDEIGGLLGEKWNLPPMILDVMKYHHDISGATEHQLLVAAVRFADILSERWGTGIQEQAQSFFLEEEDAWKILQRSFKVLAGESAETVEQKLRALYENELEFSGLFA